MWYLDRKKNQAVMSCSDEAVVCGNLKGIWAGSLWLLFAYVGKMLNFPPVRPINIERLMVEYGRSEAGLVKNLTGEGLYEPIVVSEAEFLPWVVANWEKVLMTAEEFFDDLESRRTPEYLSAQVTCYALGDDEPLEEDLQTLCYLAGNPTRLPDDSALGLDPNQDVFEEVLSKFRVKSETGEEKIPAPAQEVKKSPDYIAMCYRPIDPDHSRPDEGKAEQQPVKKPETDEPEKEK